MATIYKEHTVSPGTFVSISFGEYFVQGSNPTPDSWFDWTIETPFGFDVIIGYTFTAPSTLGTYEYFFNELLSGDTYKIVINVVVGDVTLFSNCCGDRNIAWYNIQGGWQNYIFTGIKEFRVEVGKSKQFKTNEYVSKHSQIEGVFDGEVISSGDIPKSHVDAIDNLKYAIQVFMYNTETEVWDIPIVVDVGSFSKYKSKDKFFEVRLKFIYATEILVQTQ